MFRLISIKLDISTQDEVNSHLRSGSAPLKQRMERWRRRRVFESLFIFVPCKAPTLSHPHVEGLTQHKLHLNISFRKSMLRLGIYHGTVYSCPGKLRAGEKSKAVQGHERAGEGERVKKNVVLCYATSFFHTVREGSIGGAAKASLFQRRTIKLQGWASAKEDWGDCSTYIVRICIT